MQISDLKPASFWNYFAGIAAVPHPSGKEAALAEKLLKMARAHGLDCTRDHAGNIRIDRPASPGWENAPLIILQGHLDMVPVAEDKNFDFAVTPVTVETDGEWVWAKGTTLGADDGSGLALALSVLFDRDFQCGALAGLFTVEEEIGLLGSASLAGDMLQGDMLFNMDLGSEGKLCIGCAGGARQEFTFQQRRQAAPAGSRGIKLEIGGMYGGHSGVCIHLNRGNALKFLAQFAAENPGLLISSFTGGGADNAIPAAGEIIAAAAADFDLEALRNRAEVFTLMLKQECDAPEIFLQVTACPVPESVWQEEFQQNILQSLSVVPDGVMEYDEELQIVRTSSNLAAIFSRGENLIIRSSQRSMDDEARARVSEMLKLHFAAFGAESEISSVYPGWNPGKENKLIAIANGEWEKISGKKFTVSAIHAGLECGWFVRKNPALQLLSFGPEEQGAHTPQERLNVASVARYCTWLRQLICAVGKGL